MTPTRQHSQKLCIEATKAELKEELDTGERPGKETSQQTLSHREYSQPTSITITTPRFREDRDVH